MKWGIIIVLKKHYVKSIENLDHQYDNWSNNTNRWMDITIWFWEKNMLYILYSLLLLYL